MTRSKNGRVRIQGEVNRRAFPQEGFIAGGIQTDLFKTGSEEVFQEEVEYKGSMLISEGSVGVFGMVNQFRDIVG